MRVLYACAVDVLCVSAAQRETFKFETKMPIWEAATGGIGLEVLALRPRKTAEPSPLRQDTGPGVRPPFDLNNDPMAVIFSPRRFLKRRQYS